MGESGDDFGDIIRFRNAKNERRNTAVILTKVFLVLSKIINKGIK